VFWLTVWPSGKGGGAGVDSPSKQKKLKVEKNANLAERIPTVRCTLCYVRFGLYDKIIC